MWMNRGTHIWMDHVTHEWVISQILCEHGTRAFTSKTELCHTRMSYVSHIWISHVTYMNEWYDTHMKESCHTWMSYISDPLWARYTRFHFENGIMSRVTESCLTYMNETYHITYMNHVTHQWVVSQILCEHGTIHDACLHVGNGPSCPRPPPPNTPRTCSISGVYICAWVVSNMNTHTSECALRNRIILSADPSPNLPSRVVYFGCLHVCMSHATHEYSYMWIFTAKADHLVRSHLL